MAFRPRPRKENRRSRLVIWEIAVGIITILTFGKELWLLILWLFDWIFNADSLPYSTTTGIELTEAWMTMLVVLLAMSLAMVLLLIFVSRRGAYPIRNADEIAARLPKDDSISLTNPINKPEAYVTNEEGENLPPVPPSITFNYPFLRETSWDWIFPRENKPNSSPASDYGVHIDDDEYGRLYGRTLLENWGQRIKDGYFAFFHLVRWLFGLRGYNAVIQKGTLISTDTGKNYARTRGFVISDFDGTYLLDASQNGQRTGIPPQVGWFGMQRTRRTKILESTPLGRISRFDKNISATTSDGIEITAEISAVFTLGLRPVSVDVLVNEKEEKPEDRVKTVKVKTNDAGDYFFESDTTNLLDEQDRRYIAQRANELIKKYGQQEYQKTLSSFDFEFDPQRVVRVLTSKPITNKGEPVEWRDIVLQYSKDAFQRIIKNHTFDELYGDISDYSKNRYPIDDLMDELQWEVQRDGLLNFRLYWLKNEENHFPMLQEKGKTATPVYYHKQNVGNAPTVPPQSPNAFRIFNNAEALPDTPHLEGFEAEQKFLRARGIRVIAAEIDNIRPKLPEIDDARAYVWASELKKETDEIRGEIEKESAIIMNQAVAETQAGVIDNLLDILNSGVAEDVALLKFLTALEEIANRDTPEDIIPRDFLNFIAEVRHWLNP